MYIPPVDMPLLIMFTPLRVSIHVSEASVLSMRIAINRSDTSSHMADIIPHTAIKTVMYWVGSYIYIYFFFFFFFFFITKTTSQLQCSSRGYQKEKNNNIHWSSFFH